MKRTMCILVAMIAPLVAVAPAGAATHTVTVVQHGSGSPWQHTYYWVAYRSQGHISGTVSNTALGSTVDLLASQFPFKTGYTRLARTKTTAGGRFGFAVHPSLATRFRVRTAGTTSRTLTFYVVTPFQSLSQTLCGPPQHGTCHATVTYNTWYPASVGPRETAQKAYVYVGVARSSIVQPASLTRDSAFTLTSQRVSTTKWHSTLRFTWSAPAAGPWNMAWASCTRTIESKDGFGLPVSTGCGTTTIPNEKLRLELLG